MMPKTSFNSNSPVSLHIMEASDLLHESRLRKQIAAVQEGDIVMRSYVSGRLAAGMPRVEDFSQTIEFHRMPALRGSRFRWLLFLRNWLEGISVVSLARRIRPVFIECHNLITLPWGVRIKRAFGSKLFYTPHELETERLGLNGLRKRQEKAIEKRFIGQCDTVVVVSEMIAEWYREQYGIARPLIVRNIPDSSRADGRLRSRVLRAKFGIPDDDIVFIYQGLFSPGRRVQQLLRVFERVRPGRHLVMMGYGLHEGGVREAAARNSNIHFHPVVSPEEVLRHTAGADVGLVGVENACLSYYFSLPNKFFEYLLAGLPCLTPDFPELRRVLESGGCGWLVGESESDWESIINKLTRVEIETKSEKAAQFASKLSWVKEKGILVQAYRKILEKNRVIV